MSSFNTVTDFIEYVTARLNGDSILSVFSITGELSGVTVYRSGHCYFTLKDEASCVSCVMFRGYLSQLDFTPKDGMKVVLSGGVNIYGPTGKFQINVRGMRFAGKGDLKEQYLKLFMKLQEEGLFKDEYKRKIPLLPRRIGVVTSPSGAVINDIIRTLKRRNPYFDLLIYPAAVQGDACPIEVSSGIKYLDSREDIDVIIVARGGGSYEDLFGFNSELIARSCFEATTPIISAIGHETDTSILDYVADLRAPTPTAAAELVMPVYDDLMNYVSNSSIRLDMAISSLLKNKRAYLDSLKNHRALLSPMFYLGEQQKHLNNLVSQMIKSSDMLLSNNQRDLDKLSIMLNQATQDTLKLNQGRLEVCINMLDTMSPLNVLKRGYSFITDKEDKVLSTVDGINVNDKINIRMADGSIIASVDEILDI